MSIAIDEVEVWSSRDDSVIWLIDGASNLVVPRPYELSAVRGRYSNVHRRRVVQLDLSIASTEP